VAWLTAITYQKMEDVLPLIYESGEIPLILILDHVTDVRNFGAIVRTALCSGVHAIVVPASGAAPANEEAMKASAGALAKATICKENSLFNTVMLLQDSGVQVLATALSPRAVKVWDADLTQPTAIIMGAEGDGIHPKLLKMADKTIIIPQLGEFDSYNVGVATGIVLYEAGRQRS
jgi:23S rRNA (guanosine2251-2'-O)-methyltransferase